MLSSKLRKSLPWAVSTVIAVLVLWSSQPAGQSLFAQNGEKKQEEKKVTEPPGKDGNPDKEDEPERILRRFMRQKLQASNLILEGLCTEDLEMITEGSDTLLKMSREERWRVSNDMLYRRYSKEFVASVEELKQEAEDGDLDGTSMAWVNVTMKCLKCHEWVRNTIIADSETR